MIGAYAIKFKDDFGVPIQIDLDSDYPNLICFYWKSEDIVEEVIIEEVK